MVEKAILLHPGDVQTEVLTGSKKTPKPAKGRVGEEESKIDAGHLWKVNTITAPTS